MSFFDNFGKKITSAGQAAVDKTKNFAETTKLNLKISEAQSKINDLYRTVGEKYFKAHPEDFCEDFAEQINEIKAQTALISDLKAKIAQIKGITYCTECGAEIPAESAFCSKCGAKAVRPEPAAETPAEASEDAPAVIPVELPADAPVCESGCTECGCGKSNDAE